MEEIQDLYEIGNIFEIKGEYRKRFGSITIREERILNSNEFDLSDFVPQLNIDIVKMREILKKTIINIQNDKLKTLLIKIFEDDDIKTTYIKCPF